MNQMRMIRFQILKYLYEEKDEVLLAKENNADEELEEKEEVSPRLD
jgi:hypothetical protein